MHDATRCYRSRPMSTKRVFDRGDVIAIARAMMVAHVHSTASEPAQLAAQSAAAAAGGLALCPRCHLAWASGSPLVGTPVLTQVGRSWVAYNSQISPVAHNACCTHIIYTPQTCLFFFEFLLSCFCFVFPFFLRFFFVFFFEFFFVLFLDFSGRGGREGVVF